MKAYPCRYYKRLKEGVPVKADKIEYNPHYSSSYAVRVIGVWKNPTWLDLGFFDKIVSNNHPDR